MKGEENQRKIHEALLKMLYPPPSPGHEDKEEEERLIEPSNNRPPGEELENEERYSSPSSGDDNEGENGENEKLTRAQRKRLRKRKLKEGACRRRTMIGPLLSDSSYLDKDDRVDNGHESARQNASTNFSSGEAASCSKRNKLRKRRKSKNNLSGKG